MVKKKKHVPLGERIRRLRRDSGLSLKTVANETGFSEDFLKEVEANDAMPPVGALLKISRALGVDSGLFLKEEDADEDTRRREESYRKRTKAYSYRTLTPDAKNTHLKAFNITIDPKSEHEGVEYQHEGEEFVYALKGSVEVLVGENVNRLTSGESLHFNSSVTHKLSNIGEDTAELLVILYVP